VNLTRDVVAVVALAASLAALLARAIAGALESIDRELSAYQVETPAVIPDWVDDGTASW
jgi:hypothetical protein